jgi:hypothetical protein
MCVNTYVSFSKREKKNIDHQTDGKVFYCAIHSSDDKKRTFKSCIHIFEYVETSDVFLK